MMFVSDGIFIKHNDLSSFVVKAKQTPESKFNLELQEYEEYLGLMNPLSFQSNYKLKLYCEFDLHLFPFDTQVCFIEVRSSAETL